MLRQDVLERLGKKLESDLEKILSKGELNAADWDAVKKAMCIAGMVDGLEQGSPVNEDGSSYGYSRGSYGGSYMYGDEMMSNGRMRSPVTGRYISNGMSGRSYGESMGMSGRSYGEGYSGHSIEDRMIMALEQQMDAAKTDYERQMVEKEIQRLRRGDMAR